MEYGIYWGEITYWSDHHRSRDIQASHRYPKHRVLLSASSWLRSASGSLSAGEFVWGFRSVFRMFGVMKLKMKRPHTTKNTPNGGEFSKGNGTPYFPGKSGWRWNIIPFDQIYIYIICNVFWYTTTSTYIYILYFSLPNLTVQDIWYSSSPFIIILIVKAACKKFPAATSFNLLPWLKASSNQSPLWYRKMST